MEHSFPLKIETMIRIVVGVLLASVKGHGGTSIGLIPTSMDAIVTVQVIGGPCGGDH